MGWIKNRWRDSLATSKSEWRAHVDLHLFDHGFLRYRWTNLAQIDEGIWRSNQPSPKRFKELADKGFKSILNLRGEEISGPYILEKKTCERLGLTLESIKLLAWEPPSVETIEEYERLIREMERPVLIHCKSGADRTGLAAALYFLLVKDMPVETAMEQLTFKHLHVKFGRAGVLTHMLRTYKAARDESGIGFRDWLKSGYDPEAIKAEFTEKHRKY